MFPVEPLRDLSLILETYTGEPIPVKGELDLRVAYEGQEANLVLIVVEGDGPSLMGETG